MVKPEWKIQVKGQGLSVNEIFSKFWRERGISNPVEFLSPDYYSILPSTDLKNIKQAAETFLKNLKDQKNILVYADVDTDGCSSAAIIKGYIDRLGYDASVCINSGKVHGIDLNVLEQYCFDLLIVVDSINDDPDIYEKLLNAGKEIIVLDHHIPNQDILEISDKINLVSSAVDYANPNLSGSGVCWKFVRYIDEITGNNFADDFTDLAATGIIADVCSVGCDSMENRAICNIGFRMINNVGLRSIVGKDTMNSTDIGFSVGPLINSANRMNENNLALELFLTSNSSRSKEIIKQLTKLKDQQKKKTAEIVEKIENEQLNNQINNKCYYFFITDDCENLSGLIATKLSAQYHRPVLVLHEGNDRYSGSMRAEGVENFRKIINESGIAECEGHPNSAGVSIKKEDFKSFTLYIKEQLDNYTFTTDTAVDISIDRSQVTPFILDKVKEINRISGAEFSPVTFIIENVTDYEVTKMSQGKHLCIKVPDMKFIKWNFMDWEKIPETDGKLSFIGTLEESYFAGKKSVNMFIDDFVSEKRATRNLFW